MHYRVIYRARARDEWQKKEFATSQEAHAFKRQQLARLWAATVQWRDADGRWQG